MITPPANVEVLDNSTTPRENIRAKQLAGGEIHMNRAFIYVQAMTYALHTYENSSGWSSTCLYGHSDGVVSVVLYSFVWGQWWVVWW